MSEKEDGADPLVTAIGEFRQELVGWIDALLGAARERKSRTAAPPPQTANTVPDLARGAERRRDGVTATEGRTSTREENPAEASQSPSNGDPRHRLDALARQLGARLRNPEAAKDRNAPAG